MLMVPYFEQALYALSDEQLSSPAELKKLAGEVEDRLVGGASGMPVLAIPHIISSEASCYYHSYVLADESVHQTREYFYAKYGVITDNAQVSAIDAVAGLQCSLFFGSFLLLIRAMADLQCNRLATCTGRLVQLQACNAAFWQLF